MAKNIQARKSKEDRTRQRPLSIPFLQELGALDVLKPPKGPFDPAGAWTHVYRLWLVQPWNSGGALTVARKPMAKGQAQLTVDLNIAERGGYERRTRAVLTCAADTLATPLSWTLDSQALDLDGHPIARVAVAETGSLADGRMTLRFGDHSRRQRVPAPATSNWSLFDAIQRLQGKETKPLTFALIEDLDLVKPEQRLTYRETMTIDLNGKQVKLRGYQQVGRGVLPWQYWVDDAGRLLLAFSGVRAYILDPGAPAWEEKQLSGARAALKRRRAR